jgi:hypothetical protein
LNATVLGAGRLLPAYYFHLQDIKQLNWIGDSRILPNYLILPAALGPGGFTQPLTEISIRSRKIMFPESKVWSERKADNLIAICEPIV